MLGVPEQLKLSAVPPVTVKSVKATLETLMASLKVTVIGMGSKAVGLDAVLEIVAVGGTLSKVQEVEVMEPLRLLAAVS